MNYSDIAAGSSEGLRNVIRLLSSSPPDLTVRELEEHVIRDILFSDYRKKRTASGRCHTHWKTRVYTLLMETPDLSEELIRKGVEKIFEKLSDGDIVEWTAKLWFVPNLPEELKSRFLKLNHQHFCAKTEVKKTLTAFLPVWLATSEVSPVFRQEDGAFLFSNTDWQILDKNERGSLLYVGHRYIGQEETMVVLLPDVSNRNQGCAVEVSPRVKTVHEAIAWMYQLDPEKWKRFDSEV